MPIKYIIFGRIARTATESFFRLLSNDRIRRRT